MKRIFQYSDVTLPTLDTRWIAASSKAAADAEAQRRGWVIEEFLAADNEIFKESKMRQHWKHAKDYKQAGCDVVLA